VERLHAQPGETFSFTKWIQADVVLLLCCGKRRKNSEKAEVLGSQYLFKKRKEYGEYQHLFHEMCLDEERFELYFLLSRSQLE